MSKNNIIIGIPKGLLYYKYKDLWECFFKELNIKVLYSPETNNQILENGKCLSIDESCLSLKIFLGHVHYLVNKCDYILIPRIVTLKSREKLCVTFTAIYDVVRNLFNTKILNYNIDIERGYTEKKAFIKMGKQLGFNYKKSLNAYKKAIKNYKEKQKERYIKQLKLIETSNKNKILIVSHPYNTYDKLIGYSVIKNLKQLNVDIIYADIFNENIEGKYEEISKKIYWTYSKELLEAIIHYYDKIDGIVLLTAFPCGPDSLTNEMCIRKLNIPLTNIIIDELTSEAGIQTRIESFIDIIEAKKVHNE